MSELVLEGLALYRDTVGKSDSGISWTSDQITYPGDLKGQILPDDAYSASRQVVYIHKSGGLGLYADDNILFQVYGNFRPYEQLIENDPASVVTPVMANVYVTYDAYWSSKATLTELEIHFKALDTVFPPADDPRVRYVCEGYYDPAGPGEFRFAVVVEIDSHGNVSLIEDRTGHELVVTDNSPNGFNLTVAED